MVVGQRCRSRSCCSSPHRPCTVGAALTRVCSNKFRWHTSGQLHRVLLDRSSATGWSLARHDCRFASPQTPELSQRGDTSWRALHRRSPSRSRASYTTRPVWPGMLLGARCPAAPAAGVEAEHAARSAPWYSRRLIRGALALAALHVFRARAAAAAPDRRAAAGHGSMRDIYKSV